MITVRLKPDTTGTGSLGRLVVLEAVAQLALLELADGGARDRVDENEIVGQPERRR